MNRADYLDPALCWTGCKATGRGGSLSEIGFHNLTRPKSYHLKKEIRMSPRANWSYPTAIRFGAGRISELAEACAAAGMKRPLLVTDRGLASLPITVNALDLLEAAGLGRALFAEVDPTRTRQTSKPASRPSRQAGMTG
jgi:hypothetical protein